MLGALFASRGVSGRCERDWRARLAEIGDAEHEADGVQDIGLAATIQTGDGVEVRVEVGHDHSVGVRFEALDCYLLDIHRGALPLTPALAGSAMPQGSTVNAEAPDFR